jgi:hypothetical protein
MNREEADVSDGEEEKVDDSPIFAEERVYDADKTEWNTKKKKSVKDVEQLREIPKREVENWDLRAVVDRYGHYKNGALLCVCPFTGKLFRVQPPLDTSDHLCNSMLNPTICIPNRPECPFCNRALTAKNRESVINEECLAIETMYSLCPSMPEGLEHWPWNRDCNVEKPQ